MTEIRQRREKDKEARGDVMIQGLWGRQAEAIIDIKLGNADVYSLKIEAMAALLAWWETINKDNHSKNCHYQRKHISLLILSIYGMLWREALVVLVNFSRLMVAKMDKPISHVHGWING